MNKIEMKYVIRKENRESGLYTDLVDYFDTKKEAEDWIKNDEFYEDYYNITYEDINND
jgi:hypothetical protein